MNDRQVSVSTRTWFDHVVPIDYRLGNTLASCSVAMPQAKMSFPS